METLLKKMARLCSESICGDCLLRRKGESHCCAYFESTNGENVFLSDEQVRILNKWVDEHPLKTYWDDYCEKFPNAEGLGPQSGGLGCPQAVYHGRDYGSCECELECGDVEHNVRDCYHCWNAPLGSLSEPRDDEEDEVNGETD